MADEKEKKVATKKTDTKKTAEVKKEQEKKVPVKNAETKSEVKENKDTKKENKATQTKNAPKETAKKETKAVKVKKEENTSDEEMCAKATVKYARISSRKVKIVADLIRGKKVDEAIAILKFTQKSGSEILLKLLNSAIANAENNNQMNHSKLYIAEIYSNQGPTLKRIRPAAKGSAVRIRKRTSHTTIVLKEKEA